MGAGSAAGRRASWSALVVVQRPGRALHAELGQQPLLDAGHHLPTVWPFLNQALKLRLCCSSSFSQLFSNAAG